DGQELVGGGRVAEFQLGGGLLGAQARIGERAQVGHARGQGGGELLGVRTACLVVRRRVDHRAARLRVSGGDADGELGGRRHVVRPTGARSQADRVGGEGGDDFGVGNLAFGGQREQGGGSLGVGPSGSRDHGAR